MSPNLIFLCQIMVKTRIKICCISSIAEAKTAIKYGADALGLVGQMPSGPGIISDDLIGEISNNIPPPISTFLLTSYTSAETIIIHHKKANTTTIQIVDAIPKNEYALIKAALPNVKLIQVIHVIDEQSVQQSIEIAPYVNAILLDSGNPNLAIKELGGTGRTHNWELSKQIVNTIDKPVFLAGGLNADNVESAIKTVQPFGVDLCSGVRTNNKLDERKLKAFVEAVDRAVQ